VPLRKAKDIRQFEVSGWARNATPVAIGVLRGSAQLVRDHDHPFLDANQAAKPLFVRITCGAAPLSHRSWRIASRWESKTLIMARNLRARRLG